MQVISIVQILLLILYFSIFSSFPILNRSIFYIVPYYRVFLIIYCSPVYRGSSLAQSLSYVFNLLMLIVYLTLNRSKLPLPGNTLSYLH